jgi:hypothetical protein
MQALELQKKKLTEFRDKLLVREQASELEQKG